MPYRRYPKPYAGHIRRQEMGIYITYLTLGVAVILFTPVTIEEVIGYASVWLWAALSLVGGFAGLLGVIYRRHAWEWLSIWALLGGIFVYVSTVWIIVFPDSFSRIPQALTLTLIIQYLLHRHTIISAHMAELREIITLENKRGVE